ncbi:MAG: PrsW family intramembrane metalloprotease [Treponema sp.]|jgi:RsiW-degrading membrane proteinase PrsW (M82 family)|nr:PrsW family intramembrane metalloprotease [Treponema sp.]
MNNVWILAVLILISALPALGLFIWFRLSRFPLGLLWFLAFLLGGALSLLTAGLLQGLFPPLGDSGAGSVILRLFTQIALTEEAARLVLLIPLLLIWFRFEKPPVEADAPAAASQGPVPRRALAAAAGFAAGLGFAVIETATYGAADLGIALLRAFTAAPLHGACGCRVGMAVAGFRESPVRSVLRFLIAAALHGMYDFMVLSPGMPIVFPICLVAAALASSIQQIRYRETMVTSS